MSNERFLGRGWELIFRLSALEWVSVEVKHLLWKESQESGNKSLIIGLFLLRNYRTLMWHHVVALSQQHFNTQLTFR